MICISIHIIVHMHWYTFCIVVHLVYSTPVVCCGVFMGPFVHHPPPPQRLHCILFVQLCILFVQLKHAYGLIYFGVWIPPPTHTHFSMCMCNISNIKGCMWKTPCLSHRLYKIKFVLSVSVCLSLTHTPARPLPPLCLSLSLSLSHTHTPHSENN